MGVSISTSAAGTRRLLFTGHDGVRHGLYVGKMTMPNCQFLKTKIELLIDAQTTGFGWSKELTAWVDGIGESLAKQLAVFGLIPPRKTTVEDMTFAEELPKPKSKRNGDIPGTIYFIGAGDFVKIGFTKELETRFAALQNGSPLKLKLLFSFQGVYSDETMLHHRFIKWRVGGRGEWFGLVQEILDFIEDGKRIQSQITEVRGASQTFENVGLSAGLLY